MTFTFPTAVMLDAINALIGATGVLNGAVVGLATNTDILTDQSTFADLVPPTYGGYAVSTPVVWGAPKRQADGSVQAMAGSKQFSPTDSTVSNSITYVVLLNAAGDTLLASLALDNPVHMGTPDNEMIVCFPAILAQTTLPPLDVIP
jgi:hypothetical protein